MLTGTPTVGVHDENVVDPNTVDFVATGSSLTNTAFLTQVATAFGQDSGGVIDGETLGQLYSYGTSQGKVLTIEQGLMVNGIGSFQVNYGLGSAFDANSLVLSNFSPIPEPSTYLLLGLGAVAIAFRLRRRA